MERHVGQQRSPASSSILRLSFRELDLKYRPDALGRLLLLVYLVLSPLVFSAETVEVFLYPKTAILLLTAIAFCAIGLTSAAAKHSLSATWESRGQILGWMRLTMAGPVGRAFLLFLCSAAASSVASISPRTSLLGAERSFGGLLTVLAYTVLFFSTRGCCSTPADVRLLLIAAPLTAAVTSVYGFMQAARVDPIQWGPSAILGCFVRPFGTLGHANLLAAFLVMTFPITLYFVDRSANRGSRLATGIFGLTAFLSFLVIVLSASRGAWLALACTVGLVLLGRLVTAGRRNAGLLLILIVGFAAGSLVVVRKIPCGYEIFARARELSSPGRLYIWQASWKIFRENPLYGCGLDTFHLGFERKRRPEYWFIEWNGTPDQAHNEALHLLATQGIFGAAMALLLTVTLIRAGIRAWQRSAGQRTLLTGIFAGVLGFYVAEFFDVSAGSCQALFVTFAAVIERMEMWSPEQASDEGPGDIRRPSAFALLAAGMLFAAIFLHNVGAQSAGTAARGLGAAGTLLLVFGLVAISAFRVEENTGQVAPERGYSPVPLTPTLVAIWAAALSLMYAAVCRPFEASRACKQGERELASVDPVKAAAQFERAIALNPESDYYRRRLGAAYQIAARLTKDPAERQRWLHRARGAFAESIRLVPAESYNYAPFGSVLAELAREGLSGKSEVFRAFDKALTLDPNNAHFYAAAADAAIRLGGYDRAATYASRGGQLYPRFAPLQAQLGYIALEEQRPGEAVKLLRAALSSDWHDFEWARAATMSNLAVALLRLGRAQEAYGVARGLIQLFPDYVDGRYNLAKSLEMLGRRDDCLREYRRILLTQPGHSRARQALEELGNAAHRPVC